MGGSKRGNLNLLIFQDCELRLEETKATHVECAAEVALKHASVVELVVIVHPLMNANALLEDLPAKTTITSKLNYLLYPNIKIR